MDQTMTAALVEMGYTLSGLILKGTATKIDTKIKSLKEERDANKLRSEYDEIVNQLLAERADALRIAQSYQAEIERYQISDEDIEHLHKTVEAVLEIVKNMSPQTPIDSYEKFKELISVDTLKAMQLLGFNYKTAIGEPLTQICANAITSIGGKSKNISGNKTVPKR